MPEHLATGLEFLEPERDHDRFVVTGLARLHPTRCIPQFTIGAGHEDGPHPFVGVTGQNAARPERLVIGMGVDGHERENGVCHWIERRGCAALLDGPPGRGASARRLQERAGAGEELRAGPPACVPAEFGQPGPLGRTPGRGAGQLDLVGVGQIDEERHVLGAGTPTGSR